MRIRCAVILFSLVSICSIYAQQDWIIRNPIPTGEGLNNVFYVNGTYLACGNYGILLSSINTTDWKKIQTGTELSLNSIAWGNNKYVVVGNEGEILVSVDGINWEQFKNILNGDSISFQKVVFWKDKFIAVGTWAFHDSAAICYSYDGKYWSLVSFNSKGTLFDLAYNDSTIVAVGTDNAVFISSDGIVWNEITTGINLNSIIWAADKFVAVGSIGLTGSVFKSLDGIVWGNTGLARSLPLERIAWNGKIFIACPYYPRTDTVFTSPDLTNWTTRPLGRLFGKTQIVAVGDTFIAVGEFGNINISADGVDWTSRNRNIINPTQYATYVGSSHVVWTGNKFIAILREGSDTILQHDRTVLLSSIDGIAWQKQITDSIICQKLIWGNNKLVGLNKNNAFLSTNAMSWTNNIITQDTSVSLIALASGNNQFVAVGTSIKQSSNAKIFSSSDGISWIERQVGIKGRLFDVVYGNGKFVATGLPDISLSQIGFVCTSQDGINWTRSDLADTIYKGLGKIWCLNGKFVARGNTYYQSVDGINWTSFVMNLSAAFSEMIWANNQYVNITSDSKDVYTSSDLINWTKQITNCSDENLNSIAFGANQFVIVSDYGTILTSSSATQIINFKKNDQNSQLSLFDLSVSRSAIRYSIPSMKLVKLSLFDIRGRLARSLINGFQFAGEHTVAMPRDLAQGRYVVSYRSGETKVDKVIAVIH